MEGTIPKQEGSNNLPWGKRKAAGVLGWSGLNIHHHYFVLKGLDKARLWWRGVGSRMLL